MNKTWKIDENSGNYDLTILNISWEYHGKLLGGFLSHGGSPGVTIAFNTKTWSSMTG
jgi:hypothetical protein